MDDTRHVGTFGLLGRLKKRGELQVDRETTSVRKDAPKQREHNTTTRVNGRMEGSPKMRRGKVVHRVGKVK